MGKVRIGMIGAGVHATNMLYPSCEHIVDLVERVAVCDLIEQKAKSAIDFKKMLRGSGVVLEKMG